MSSEHHVNPFLEHADRYNKLQENCVQIAMDLKKIAIDLKRKLEILQETENNHIDAYKQEIDSIGKMCTHRDEHGDWTCDPGEAKKIGVAEDGKTLAAVRICSLCKKEFLTDDAKIQINTGMKQRFNNYLNEDRIQQATIENEPGGFVEFDPTVENPFADIPITIRTATGVVEIVGAPATIEEVGLIDDPDL